MRDVFERYAGKDRFDVVVVCGEPEFEDREGDTLLNPTVVVEVLSPSTEAWDRGEKSFQYRALPSIQDYLLISQDGLAGGRCTMRLRRTRESGWNQSGAN